jgi:glyoxylase-like metal-dependent hydrolase (beta-lactamase superfamily II)
MKDQTRSHFLLATTSAIAASALPHTAHAAVTRGSVVQLADGISYVPGDIERRLAANTGFIEAEGGLIVVDAAIPEGAAAAYAAIRRTSPLAPRHVINTHYHLDHLYGNAFW